MLVILLKYPPTGKHSYPLAVWVLSDHNTAILLMRLWKEASGAIYFKLLSGRATFLSSSKFLVVMGFSGGFINLTSTSTNFSSTFYFNILLSLLAWLYLICNKVIFFLERRTDYCLNN